MTNVFGSWPSGHTTGMFAQRVFVDEIEGRAGRVRGSRKIAPVPYSISTKLATYTGSFQFGSKRMHRADAGVKTLLLGGVDDFLRGADAFYLGDEPGEFGFLAAAACASG